MLATPPDHHQCQLAPVSLDQLTGGMDAALDVLTIPPLDRGTATPLVEQLVRRVRRAIAEGRIEAGEGLPSTRALARALHVSRGTVVAACEQLVAEGHLVTRPGSGIRVHPEAARTLLPPTPSGHRRALPSRPMLDLTPGVETARPLDDPGWRRALREAASPPSRPAWEVDPQGQPELRLAIAAHLRLTRGMQPDIDRMVVTAGARDALALVAQALRHRLGRPVRCAVERPGFPGLRRALPGLGVELDTDLDQSGRPDLALVTPNHQFPGGTSLGAVDRTRLIEWAAARGCLLLEDDYDSQFRHLGAPQPSIWQLSDEQVVHLGTFAGVMGRDVGTGYVLLPSGLVPDVLAVRSTMGAPVAPLLQRALAQHLTDGSLRRRLARGRRRLQACQAVAQQAIASMPALAGARDHGHILVLPCSQARAVQVQARCRALGVGVGLLSDGWDRDPAAHGLVLSYGDCSPDELGPALAVLADCLEEH